jgi:hypothetical protein
MNGVGKFATTVNKQRDCGGMVYTADLKSAAHGIEGSSPSSRTN